MTDEELAAIEARLKTYRFGDAAPLTTGTVRDMLAALREARARVEVLEKALARWAVEASPKRTWCDECHTESLRPPGVGLDRIAARATHPHAVGCVLHVAALKPSAAKEEPPCRDCGRVPHDFSKFHCPENDD